MSSANREFNFILSDFDVFYFSCLLSLRLEYNPEQEWWKWSPLSCFCSSRKSFQFFCIEDDVSCGLIAGGLYYVEVCAFQPNLLRFFFYHERMLNFVKFFFFCHLLRWSYDFIFHSINGTFTNLYILNLPCIPGVNPSWSCAMEFNLIVFCWEILHLPLLGILVHNFL